MDSQLAIQKMLYARGDRLGQLIHDFAHRAQLVREGEIISPAIEKEIRNQLKYYDYKVKNPYVASLKCDFLRIIHFARYQGVDVTKIGHSFRSWKKYKQPEEDAVLAFIQVLTGQRLAKEECEALFFKEAQIQLSHDQYHLTDALNRVKKFGIFNNNDLVLSQYKNICVGNADGQMEKRMS